MSDRLAVYLQKTVNLKHLLVKKNGPGKGTDRLKCEPCKLKQNCLLLFVQCSKTQVWKIYVIQQIVTFSSESIWLQYNILHMWLTTCLN